MAHSRSKGHRQQPERPQETSQQWNRGRNPSSMNYAGEGSSSGYGEGRYGGQGGYRSINYVDRFGNPRGESEFEGSREYQEDPRYGQQDWRSSESGWRPESGWRMENRQEQGGRERMQQFRGSQPERAYRQWGNDAETDDMNRGRWEGGRRWESGRWEGGMEPGREPSREPQRQRSNVTRFGQRSEGQPGSSAAMPGRQSFAGRGPQGYKRSDDRITEDINEELTQDSELDASDVNIEVRNGEVVLKGTVPDRESKRRAEEIVERCSGVKDVMNQLRVKREESSDSENSSRRDKSDDKRNKVAS